VWRASDILKMLMMASICSPMPSSRWLVYVVKGFALTLYLGNELFYLVGLLVLLASQVH